MAGARFIMQKGYGLIADEPGLGKTIQSIGAVVGAQTRGSVLIVAPKTAAYVTWPEQLSTWLSDLTPDDPVRTLGGQLDRTGRMDLMRTIIKWEIANGAAQQDPSSLPRRQWVICSPNYLRLKYKLDSKGRFVYDKGEKIVVPVREAMKQLLAIPWGAIIVDEAHETLAGATGAVKKQSAQSQGIRMLQTTDNGLRIALSGTPFRGKHENIWGIANWLDPEGYNHTSGPNSYWKWIHRHFQVFHDDVYNTDIIGNLRSERDMARECKQFMIRRTKKKVAPELPDKLYPGTPHNPKKKPPSNLPADQRAAWYYKNNPIAVWLPMEGQQKRAYDQMKREAMADLEGGTLLANSLLAEMTRLKQFANSSGRLGDNGEFLPQLPSNKFDWLLQFLAERGIDGPEPSGNRVVVASQFTRHIELFAGQLREKHGIRCYTLTGKTTAEERKQYQQEFQSGTLLSGKGPSPEVFILNIKAGGTAITLDAADDLVLVDTTHNPDEQVQVEDRIHRISRIHQVTIHQLCSRGTIDEQILKTTRKMGRSLKRILDTPSKAIDLLAS